MIDRSRRRRGNGPLALFAGLMTFGWLGLVFLARSLAATEKTAGFGAFLGFFVIALSVVLFCLFMMAVDSDRA